MTLAVLVMVGPGNLMVAPNGRVQALGGPGLSRALAYVLTNYSQLLLYNSSDNKAIFLYLKTRHYKYYTSHHVQDI